MAENKIQLLSNIVIIEILSWLPVKSLLRFKWVCKYWSDLITSDSFRKIQHQHSTTTTIPSVLRFCFMNSDGSSHSHSNELFQGYYLNYNDDTNYDIPSEVNQIGHQLIHKILGSSNGLILLLMTTTLLKNTHLRIFNPCTKEYKVLPGPKQVYNEDEDSVFMHDAYGFGYDQAINDYKVIRIKHYNAHGDVRFDVQVYTLGKNSWRRIIGSNIPCQLQDCWFGSGVFLNGVLYWMDSTHHNIISFDIGREKFHHVSRTPNLLPDHQFGFVNLPKLQVFEGSLCLLLTINGYHNSPVEIWVMKKDYTVVLNNSNNNESSLWTKLLTIPHYFPIKIPTYIRNGDFSMGVDFPTKLLRYSRNGEILMLSSHTDLVSYDPKNTSYQTLCSSICEDDNPFSALEVYTESLISLNSGTYMDQQPKEEHNIYTSKRRRFESLNSRTCTDQQQREENNTNKRKKMR